MTKKEIKERLEYLRGEIRAERVSSSEIVELQTLAKHIEPNDVELLEWAGVPEFEGEMILWVGSYSKNGDDDWNMFVSPQDDFAKARERFKEEYESDNGEEWIDSDYSNFEVFPITLVNGHRVKLEPEANQ